jgi:hypothetical protein
VSDYHKISQTTRLDGASIKILLLGDARTSCKLLDQINIPISLLQPPRLTLNRRYFFYFFSQEKAATTDRVPFLDIKALPKVRRIVPAIRSVLAVQFNGDIRQSS